MGESLEHKVLRTNLERITRLISSDPSAGPTWFALKLVEKAFIANAAGAVVVGHSEYKQTNGLMGAVMERIHASKEPKKEFSEFIEILQSSPQLQELARELDEDCEALQQAVAKGEPARAVNEGGESDATGESRGEESGDGVLQVVQQEVLKLEDKFGDLVHDTQKVFSVEERKSPDFLPLIRTRLALLSTSQVKKYRYIRFLKASQREIFKASGVGDLFVILSHYWNYFNYSLLEFLIQIFGNGDLKTKLGTYLADLLQFEKCTKVKDFVHACSIDYELPPSSVKIAMEMEAKWADYTLDHVRELGQELVAAACLEHFCAFFLGGSCSRVYLMWAVPSTVVHLISKVMDASFLRKHEIERVTIDGMDQDYLLEKIPQQPEVEERPDPQRLLSACENGNLCDVLDLLDAGVSVDTRDTRSEMTPLHLASEKGHHDTVRVLLEHHADVNARDEPRKRTPLHLASEEGHPTTAQVLLEHHADVNACDWSWKTPLHLTIEEGHHDTVLVLLEHQADVNEHDGWNRKTPLHLASEKGHLDTVRVLLEHHADVNACDRYGRTPMELARGHPDVIKELGKYVPSASDIQVNISCHGMNRHYIS